MHQLLVALAYALYSMCVDHVLMSPIFHAGAYARLLAYKFSQVTWQRCARTSQATSAASLSASAPIKIKSLLRLRCVERCCHSSPGPALVHNLGALIRGHATQRPNHPYAVVGRYAVEAAEHAKQKSCIYLPVKLCVCVYTIDPVVASLPKDFSLFFVSCTCAPILSTHQSSRRMFSPLLFGSRRNKNCFARLYCQFYHPLKTTTSTSRVYMARKEKQKHGTGSTRWKKRVTSRPIAKAQLPPPWGPHCNSFVVVSTYPGWARLHTQRQW